MNVDAIWGPLTLAACAASLVVLVPAFLRCGRAAYAEAQAASERLFLPPRRPDVGRPTRTKTFNGDPLLPFRPAA